MYLCYKQWCVRVTAKWFHLLWGLFDTYQFKDYHHFSHAFLAPDIRKAINNLYICIYSVTENLLASFDFLTMELCSDAVS